MTVLVGGGPGSLPDLFARPLADRLSRSLGQPVVVDNKPGAGGMIAIQALKAAPADGHTLAVITNAHAVWNPHIFAKLTYDPKTDLVPVSPVATIPMALVVNPALPVNTVQELFDLAREKPGALNYASSGNGSPPHVLFEMMRRQAEADIVHVPFKTGTDALTSVAAGDTQIYFAGTSLVAPMVRDGRLRLLAVSPSVPGEPFAGVPTLQDAGFPGLEGVVWLGVVTNQGTPAQTVERLNHAVAEAARDPSMRQAFDSHGALLLEGSAAEFAQRIESDRATWDPVLEKMGLNPG
ncbi:tripartite tricarboxylate transporter substrate binding protein [Verticiella sediminum]|uniref:Tripartite tricarboxylate transporter substrate binding protein n=2 Tax=Verticiella sediminum TaxID=1247510 RepID=A0A556B0K0_9BURK|nr:tripartite tricarboxylate transporter substrate binding protein [Verticiella sediminum]